ncbi:hypothetical protein BJF78_26190 [Pseudonocardia sp. CNS-139]|nr:hypothetical protein BJF78_26190 [Pseudonocardia sp. CNS-139]
MLTAARCAAMQGRAYSLRNDAGGAARSRLLAEQLLDRSSTDNEPSWIQFFTPTQLAVESQYIAADLGQHEEVKRLAPLVTPVNPPRADGMQRRRVLSTAVLASAYLPLGGDSTNPDRHSGVDVDYACRLLTEVLPALPSLTSTRAQTRVDQVRRSLAPYRSRASVVQLEELHYDLSTVSAPTVSDDQ